MPQRGGGVVFVGYLISLALATTLRRHVAQLYPAGLVAHTSALPQCADHGAHDSYAWGWVGFYMAWADGDVGCVMCGKEPSHLSCPAHCSGRPTAWILASFPGKILQAAYYWLSSAAVCTRI